MPGLTWNPASINQWSTSFNRFRWSSKSKNPNAFKSSIYVTICRRSWNRVDIRSSKYWLLVLYSLEGRCIYKNRWLLIIFCSNVVAYWNFFNPLKISGIFGIGKGFLFKHLFNIRKSVITRTVPFFFGMMKVRAAHLTDCILVDNPIPSNCSISHFVTSMYAFGIEYGLPKKCFDPGKSSSSIGSLL